MGRRKQKKYEKELRDRRAAEDKVNKQEERKAAEKERQAAEKERRASLTPEQRASENTTDAKMAMGCFVIVLILVVIVAVACQAMGGDDEDDDTGSSSSDYSYDSSDDDYSYSDDTVSSADAEQWLKSQLGVSEFSEILASDPTLWGGYINGIEVDGSMMHVRLQVDHDADQEMADRAAHAIANLARMTSDSTVDGLSWVIIEDGTGRNMAQESV